ncbi:MAG: hypothetical protein ACRD5L_15380 [Bryobacteraceae bacterium]
MANVKTPYEGSGHEVEDAAGVEESCAPEKQAADFPAVLVEISTGLRIEGNLAECNMLGCYVEAESTFPARSAVRLRLSQGAETFEAAARVAYAQPGVGMGVIFRQAKAAERKRLDQWLADGLAGRAVMAGRQIPRFGGACGNGRDAGASAASFEALVRLLARKGFLSAEEELELREGAPR